MPCWLQTKVALSLASFQGTGPHNNGSSQHQIEEDPLAGHPPQKQDFTFPQKTFLENFWLSRIGLCLNHDDSYTLLCSSTTMWHEHSRGLRAPLLVKAGVYAVMSMWIVHIKEHLWTTGTYPSMVLLPTGKGFKPMKLNLIWYDVIW